MVSQRALQHIDQFVITAGVCRLKKEPWIDEISNRVMYDTLHNFTIEKLQPYPDPMDDRRLRIEIDIVASRLPIEAVNVENGLYISD